MDLSGIIFVVLAVAWAVYLIPKALKHHDEVARTRSIDRFSTAMRVLARREPVNRRESRLVITRARTLENPRVLVPAAPQARAVTAPPSTRRAAARAAARRRRWILSFLLLCTAVVTGLAAFAVLQWWTVAIPVALSLLFLLLCRTQVLRASRASWEADLEADVTNMVEQVRTAAEESGSKRGAVRVEVPYGTPLPGTGSERNAQGLEEIDPDEETLALRVTVLDAVAVSTDDGGTLWDPLPVTLPTYVTKPKAKRTVRTIELGEPGTWTSGRTAEAAQPTADPAPASSAEAPQSAEQTDAGVDHEAQRAVGS
ncbi:hypothetical protein BH18ACT9_BH18ACT9_18510 [soil metagenome]